MKTYLKTLARMFKKHITRFISIIFIVVVAVGFISGLGSSTEKIRYSFTDYYRAQNVSDLIVKNLSGGFSEEQISAVKKVYGEDNVNVGASMDVYLDIDGECRLTRLYFYDGEQTVNVKEVISSKDISSGVIASAEVSDNEIKEIDLGTEIELDLKDILGQLAAQGGQDIDLSFMPEIKVPVIVGEIIKSPLTFANDGEPSYLNTDLEEVPDSIGGLNDLITLEDILYLSYDAVPAVLQQFFPKGDLYISFTDKSVFKDFDKTYERYVSSQEKVVLEALDTDADGVKFISLQDNYSFVSLSSYADKVMGIGLVLMAAFLFVTALVVLSNMTRLMEEERSQIACLRTLGYSSFKIVFKYALFAMIATGIGGVAAYFVGLGLAYLICFVFNYSFSMPPISTHMALPFFLIVFAVIVVTALAATLIAGLKMTRATCAELLRPKPPKHGKKVFLERIPLIWNRLSFKYKSTMRNVLRYMNRFIMTVVAVAVSMALVLAGLALLDVCIFGDIKSASVMAIAFVVIIFAGLLTAVVIYTLTNINISERNRELATLKVLGYHDKEVAGYIYREVYIDATVGILVGYPLSIPIMLFLFWVLGMGSVGGVSWFWWLVAPAVVYLFTFIVTLLLTPKIKKIDMNESLKAVE